MHLAYNSWPIFTHFFGRVKFNMCCSVHHRAIFVWPWKIILVSVHYLFYQPVDEKIKTWPLCFPTKENPYMGQTLFNWPNMLQYDIKAKHWLISRKFFHASVRLTNQKPRKINQIALFQFVCCFCFVRAFPFQGLTKIALSSCNHKLLLRFSNTYFVACGIF